METRELRYFVAVAEELHFGRAADRLGIAQPPLSRAITQLERQLGVTLLQRTSRRVALTAAGAVLLSEGRTILGAVAAAERRTQRAAAGHPSLVLATKAGASGELLVKLLDAYASEPGAIAVDLLLCDSQEQRQLLWQGHADVALMHLPFDSTAGLDTEVLCTERQVAILPATHALAGHTNVRMADVATLPELPLARWPSADGTFPEGPGAEVRNLTQLFQLIALGRTMVIIPESASVDLRRDLVAVPVLDAPVVTTVIAWPQLSRSRAVADLIRVATLPQAHRLRPGTAPRQAPGLSKTIAPPWSFGPGCAPSHRHAAEVVDGAGDERLLRRRGPVDLHPCVRPALDVRHEGDRSDHPGGPLRPRRSAGQRHRPADRRARHRHPRGHVGQLRSVRPGRQGADPEDPGSGEGHPVP